MTLPVIGFAGLTHLGINSQAAAAAHGFQTVGFHPDPKLADQLSQMELPVSEPDLLNLFEAHTERLAFGADPQVLSVCDLVYISVDVPTNDQGQSDLLPIKEMVDTVFPVMKPGAVLIVLCQVPPGFTRQLSIPHEQLYYQVETLIFGRAVERAMHPERFIVGCRHPEKPLPIVLEVFLNAFDCPILSMRYESAELTKISINMCLVASVSVANTMADLCEGVGADWNEIVPALKLDKRIGQFAYLKPGLGIAGGNLERDLTTVIELADQVGGNAKVVKAWISDSIYRKNWVMRKLRNTVLRSQREISLGILGLAYKENTASTKNSASVALLHELMAGEQDHKITVFDPQVGMDGIPISGVVETENALAACRGTQVVVIMTPWPEFGALSLEDIVEVMDDEKIKWLMDPYRLFDPVDCNALGLEHITLGRFTA